MLIVYYSTSEIEMTSQQGTNSLAPILEVPLYCKGFLLPLTDLLEFALCCSANYVYTSVGRVQQIVICPVPPNYRADLLTKWCTRSTFKLWSTQLSGQPVPLADAEAVDEEEEEEREFEQQLSQWKKTEVSDNYKDSFLTSSYYVLCSPAQVGGQAKPKYNVKTFEELTVSVAHPG